MADMGADEDLVSRRSWQDQFAVSQAPWTKRAIDADLVVAVSHLLQHAMRQTESPIRLVVGSAVGYEVRLFRESVQMRAQFQERHPGVHRDAVTDYVQIRFSKIDYPLARRIGYPGV